MKKIKPFSNGTSFMIWHDNNCATCNKYENTSTSRSNAKCKYAFDLDLATVSDGEIPLNTAKWIGYDGCYLNNRCNIYNIEFKKVKIDWAAINQMTLF